MIELTPPEEKILSPSEQKDYNAAIFAVFPRLEANIKEEMFKELVKTYTLAVGSAKSVNEVALATARGSGIIEGMALLLEKWRLAQLEHQAPKVDEI